MTLPTPALLHGFLGFKRRGPIVYFRGVAKALNKVGIVALVPEVPATGRVSERAESLAGQLFSSDAPCFALVAHSMGGLDARYLITHLDPDRRVKSLVTVATPHLGTPVASAIMNSHGWFRSLIRRIGMPGLLDLTPEIRAAMPIPDRADVHYASYAGRRSFEELPLVFRPFAREITSENDGLVPLESARWGEFRGTRRTDHFEYAGWSLGLPSARKARPFDHLPFWVQVVEEARQAAQAQRTE
jgi:triacylglycerol lipase